MFDNYVFTDNSCRNFALDGAIKGFQLETLITYYRGVPLSMVYDLAVTVDGLPIPREVLRISVDNENWFTLDEAETAVNTKWEFGEPLEVRAFIDGGLRKGVHDVELSLAVFPAYYPMPAGGKRLRQVVVA